MRVICSNKTAACNYRGIGQSHLADGNELLMDCDIYFFWNKEVWLTTVYVPGGATLIRNLVIFFLTFHSRINQKIRQPFTQNVSKQYEWLSQV